MATPGELSTAQHIPHKAEGNIPLVSEGAHGEDKNGTATATCFCGTVQIEFPVEGEGFVDSFICNCSDCHKLTVSMFASNFVVKDTHTTHVRGKDKITKYAEKKTTDSGNVMENNFCSVCGSLMYRISSGFPGLLITRIGSVDDFTLHDTKLKPRFEQFTKNRPKWLSDKPGIEAHEGNYLGTPEFVPRK